MEQTTAAPLVLIVDDDRGLARLIEKALHREGLQTAVCTTSAEAVAWLARNNCDLMLLDLKLQDSDGQELIQALEAADNRPPFIIITGQGDERVAVEMMKRGAMDYLVKDVDFLQFVPAVVRRALEKLEKDRRLALAEERVRLVQVVVEHGFSCVLISNSELPDPRIEYINPAFAQVTGYQPSEVVGHRLSEVSGLARVLDLLRGGVPDGAQFLEEVCTYQANGQELWGEWRVGPVSDSHGRVTHFLVILRDITERKRLEKEILEISDRERRRIGQDLHDGLSQQLAGIELMCQVLEQKLGRRSKTNAAQVAEIGKHVRDAIGQTRSMARGLAPVTLESEGLVSALHELAANAERMFGVLCHLDCPSGLRVQNLAVSTHLYRITQEAVTNAIKHGKARHVSVTLQPYAGHLQLTVVDDGLGLPHAMPANKGMGLSIMRYRASMIGGAVTIANGTSGVGVVVSCSAPNPAHPEGFQES